ncbi:hypothetical protein KEJ27_07280 [Candidatus Bathyarchaeota archaeon]|nr:hypothetical protein [Candidatus Bathyarchaeota archaeon]MBS7613220.1 hypothetical protein [Candidatus Bathyarchaeota archaeon]MBS7617258.1 hypothetical protein [Candidatus Bathyarchaeota archaeon]
MDIKSYVSNLCRKLVEFDPDIVEIVQFGSSVYAPKYARDVDLFIATKRKKDYGRYLDLVNPCDAPINVDIIVHEIGEALKEDLLRNILGAFNILYGSGDCIRSLSKSLGDPTFDQAESYIRGALEDFKLSKEAVDPLDKDRRIREAFDALFHAARIASMVYLSTEVTRWGIVRRMLPNPYVEKFEQIIEKLHIEYFYRGNYPKENLEPEFNMWLTKVKDYINRLKMETKRRAEE